MSRLIATAALTLLSCGALLCQPSYSAASIVNLADQSAGPYAPNSLLSIFGTGLAYSARSLTSADVVGGSVPTLLNGVQVMVDGSPAPLFYVSPGQINFLMPPNRIAGPVTIWTVLNSTAGPLVTITLQAAAPALFASAADPGFAVAQQWPLYGVIAPESPAPPGAIVILYATGLGPTEPYPVMPAEIPTFAGEIVQFADLRVLLNGAPLPASQVLYAGICPNFAGLYQIDLILPADAPLNPQIQVAMADAVSAPGLALAVQ
ncbi:MAG TPA: hypothetical protein VMU19_05970 [Bryobacteraceae bacterium]|nr:hypothetical protein [Bryobacteraceae bacterium]